MGFRHNTVWTVPEYVLIFIAAEKDIRIGIRRFDTENTRRGIAESIANIT